MGGSARARDGGRAVGGGDHGMWHVLVGRYSRGGRAGAGCWWCPIVGRGSARLSTVNRGSAGNAAAGRRCKALMTLAVGVAVSDVAALGIGIVVLGGSLLRLHAHVTPFGAWAAITGGGGTLEIIELLLDPC